MATTTKKDLSLVVDSGKPASESNPSKSSGLRFDRHYTRPGASPYESVEWEMRDADGQPIGRFCYNSGYLDAMKAIVSELLSTGIQGLHVDMLDQGFGPPYGCWCFL